MTIIRYSDTEPRCRVLNWAKFGESSNGRKADARRRDQRISASLGRQRLGRAAGHAAWCSRVREATAAARARAEQDLSCDHSGHAGARPERPGYVQPAKRLG